MVKAGSEVMATMRWLAPLLRQKQGVAQIVAGWPICVFSNMCFGNRARVALPAAGEISRVNVVSGRRGLDFPEPFFPRREVWGSLRFQTSPAKGELAQAKGSRTGVGRHLLDNILRNGRRFLVDDGERVGPRCPVSAGRRTACGPEPQSPIPAR